MAEFGGFGGSRSLTLLPSPTRPQDIEPKPPGVQLTLLCGGALSILSTEPPLLGTPGPGVQESTPVSPVLSTQISPISSSQSF